MRIVCDSCGAVYKIADDKLVKEVNKATCKRCGHKIIIRKPRSASSIEGPSERTVVSSSPSAVDEVGPGGSDKEVDEKKVITTIPELQKYENAAVSAGAIGSLTSELRTISSPADIPEPPATESLGPSQGQRVPSFDSGKVADPPPPPEPPTFSVPEPSPIPEMPRAPGPPPTGVPDHPEPMPTAPPTPTPKPAPSISAPIAEPPPPPPPPTPVPQAATPPPQASAGVPDHGMPDHPEPAAPPPPPAAAAAPPPPPSMPTPSPVAPPPPPNPAITPGPAPAVPPPPAPNPAEISIAIPPESGPMYVAPGEVESQLPAAPPPPPVTADQLEESDLNAALNQPAGPNGRGATATAEAAPGEVRTATREMEASAYQPKGEFIAIILFCLLAMVGLATATVAGPLGIRIAATVGFGLVWSVLLTIFLIAIVSGLGRRKGRAFLMLFVGLFLGFGLSFGLSYALAYITPNIPSFPTDFTPSDFTPGVGDGTGDGVAGDQGTGDQGTGDQGTGDQDTGTGDQDTGDQDTGDQDAAVDADTTEDKTPEAVEERPAIIFASTPSGATVYMNGSRLGRASYRFENGTPGKRYTVEYRKDGYRSTSASGTFTSNGSITIRGRLEKEASEEKTPEPTSELPDATEVLTPAIIDAIVGSNAAIKRCFAEADARGDTVSGKIWVKFTVSPDGNVSKAHITTADFAGTDLDSCVSGQINRLQFAPFSGTTSKTVKYPFVVK